MLPPVKRGCGGSERNDMLGDFAPVDRPLLLALKVEGSTTLAATSACGTQWATDRPDKKILITPSQWFCGRGRCLNLLNRLQWYVFN